MTSTNTGPHTTTVTADVPHEVWLNWRESAAAAGRANDIETKLPALDEEIDKVERHLNWLKSEHKRFGRDITAERQKAEVHRELVELWCTKHGRPVPAELTAEDLQPAAPQTAKNPCMENPPRHGDCSDPLCPCIHHDAERDARAGEQTRAADLLGQGVAGEATTQTLIDGQSGGGDAGNGDFQPQNGQDGERGEGRA